MLYNWAIHAYQASIHLAASFNSKAQLWVKGRKNLIPTIAAAREQAPSPPVIFHCASLGEFEQAVPVMNLMHERHPNQPIWLTFFSPSGFQHAKIPDYIQFYSYLPADTIKNARAFVDAANPRAFITIKYEVWPNLFGAFQQHSIPIYIIAAVFRADQIYFKPYGSFFLKALNSARAITLQYPVPSAIQDLVTTEMILTGDTRFNRSNTTALTSWGDAALHDFVGEEPCLILGSCWEPELEIIYAWIRNNPKSAPRKIILAPHDVSEKFVAQIQQSLPGAIRYSSVQNSKCASASVLILDGIGKLKYAYRYATVAFVGGGFNNKLHNILEPLAYHLPVVFGPSTTKYPEAAEALEIGAAKSITSHSLLQQLWINTKEQQVMKEAAQQFVDSNLNAAQKTFDILDRGIFHP